MQVANAAGALAVLEAARGLGLFPGVGRPQVEAGLRSVVITGRYQTVATSPDIILDAGHNPHAARELRKNLLAGAREGSRTLAVVGMLRDKDRRQVASIVGDAVDRWFVAGLTGPRASTAEELAAEFAAAGIPAASMQLFASVPLALAAARTEARSADRMIIFGSFVTVSAAIVELRRSGLEIAVFP